jgi:hypothetical protein
MKGRKNLQPKYVISYACITLDNFLADEILDIHAILVNFLFFCERYLHGISTL